MKSIRTIYVSQNKVDEYYDYVKTVPNADFTVNEEDSVTYEAAENMYMKGNCEESIKGFRTYLTKFPVGYFAVNAHYYLADCLKKANDREEALKSYMFVC